MAAPSLHLGIIPDGNRRWCASKGCSSAQLVDRICSKFEEIERAPGSLSRVSEISVYLLSKDNLCKRKDDTLSMVTQVLSRLWERLRERPSLPSDVRVQFVGERHLLPTRVQELLCTIETGLDAPEPSLVITGAIAYDPISDARTLGAGGRRPAQSPIDLVIRTGGERRSSGFFPLHTLYSEWHYVDQMFPDLALQDVEDALQIYETRSRRYGA